MFKIKLKTVQSQYHILSKPLLVGEDVKSAAMEEFRKRK
jgi:hypothetical protein